MAREADFQLRLRKEIEEQFPGSIVIKGNSQSVQGIPDWIVVYKDKYAFLECKKSEHEKHQPNQDYYVDLLNRMSYASFVYPENKEEVLDALHRTFGA